MSEKIKRGLALGIDLGTSSVKVVLLDEEGRVVASGTSAFPTVSELPGQAEQHPSDWLTAAGQAMQEMDLDLTPSQPDWRARIETIGLAGQLPTLVCLRDDQVIGTAITWKDARADSWASEAIDARLRRSLYEQTGMPIDGRYLGPMLHFHYGDRISEISSVLSAKDYLCFALTGEKITDPSTVAGYGTYDLTDEAFTQSLCDQWGLNLSAMPEVRPSHALAGLLSIDGAQILGLRSGIPVATGAADSVAGAYGLAGLEQGVACISMGSSTIIIDAIRERRLDPATRYLLTPHVEAGWYGREMDLLATGTGHNWLSRLFGWTGGQLDAMAAQSKAGARGLTFTPYLAGGEQGALWDPDLRGDLKGLMLQHDATDIARAFLEGVYFEIRRCIDVLAEAAPVKGIVISGGIVGCQSSLQMLADILQQPIQPAQPASAAAQGAALGAQQLVRPIDVARNLNINIIDSVVRPGTESEIYQDLYTEYLWRNSK